SVSSGEQVQHRLLPSAIAVRRQLKRRTRLVLVIAGGRAVGIAGHVENKAAYGVSSVVPALERVDGPLRPILAVVNHRIDLAEEALGRTVEIAQRIERDAGFRMSRLTIPVEVVEDILRPAVLSSHQLKDDPLSVLASIRGCAVETTLAVEGQ